MPTTIAASARLGLAQDEAGAVEIIDVGPEMDAAVFASPRRSDT